jgi:hypothetical protein
MKIRKIQECQVPVWENNQATDATEARVLVVFADTAVGMNGLKTFTRIGSMFLDAGVTLAQAQEKLDLDADYSDDIEFVAKPDSNFFRAVLR